MRKVDYLWRICYTKYSDSRKYDLDSLTPITRHPGIFFTPLELRITVFLYKAKTTCNNSIDGVDEIEQHLFVVAQHLRFYFIVQNKVSTVVSFRAVLTVILVSQMTLIKKEKISRFGVVSNPSQQEH